MTDHSFGSRIIGFTASLILTLAAFFLFVHPDSFDQRTTAIVVLLLLAFMQFAVQSIFFLNILGEKGVRWNLIIYSSTLSILFIIVAGAIWIMHHLNYNMMPH